MYLTSTGIVNGYILEQFGKFGSEQIDGVPIRSIPIAWHDLPQETITLTLTMQDYDAVPVCGFSWLHWLVANIDPARKELKENASREDHILVQGKNSLASKQICGEMPEKLINYYEGPKPPDKTHEYQVTVYALDTALQISNGFYLNELKKLMQGHVLAEAKLFGKYPAFR